MHVGVGVGVCTITLEVCVDVGIADIAIKCGGLM